MSAWIVCNKATVAPLGAVTAPSLEFTAKEKGTLASSSLSMAREIVKRRETRHSRKQLSLLALLGQRLGLS
jgi:hypothetical protein